MTDNIFQRINKMLTKEDVQNILQNFGFNASCRRNFRLRDDDKNPSASIFIHNSGIPMIKDFGGAGFVGDIFKTLKVYAGMPYKDSLVYIKKYLGLENIENSFEENLIQKYVKKINIKEKENYVLSPEEIDIRWNKLTYLKLLNENKFKEAVEKLVSFTYFENADKKNQKEFLNNVRFSHYADDVAVKTNTPDGKILAYKYRRWKNKDGSIIKWKALKGSPANKYSQIRIINENEPVFIIEGYHDYINAVLTGINFIAIPYKAYKNFKKEELDLLKNGKYFFVLIQDYDFEETDEKKLQKKIEDSKIQALNINKTFSVFAKNGKVLIWQNIRKRFKDLKNIETVKDFSDLINIFSFKNPELFKNRLIYEVNKSLEIKKKENNKINNIKEKNKDLLSK